MKTVAALLLLVALSTPLFQQKLTPQSDSLAFTHATVIDMTGAPAKPNMTVVITGDRITAIGRTGRVRIPQAAKVIDASGKFLIPGLWDMHVHFTEIERSLPLFIANGVTGVRNMGGNLDDLFRWRAEIAAGKLLGPRIVMCGPILDGPNPSAHGPTVAVGSAAEARKVVADLKQRGVDFVKVYEGLSRDAYFAIADEAKKQGIPFVGHNPLSVTTIETSNAGQKSIEHLGRVLESISTAEAELRRLEALPMPTGDFSEFPRRIAARGELMLKTYNERRAQRIFARLRKNKTWQVPTLTMNRAQTFVDEISRAGDVRLKYIPRSEQEWWSPQKNFFSRYRTPEYIVFKKKLFQKSLEIVNAMHRAGVEFMAGTDVSGAYIFPGFSLHEELALLVQAGFTPMEALQTATRNPAVFLGELNSLGTVERGKIANLVLLEANPLENINNTQRINAVILKGNYLPKEALQKMLADVEAAANKK